MNKLLTQFRALIYEPEHTETLCWCKPQFLKRASGNLEIVHNEQRDVLTNFMVQAYKLGAERAVNYLIVNVPALADALDTENVDAWMPIFKAAKDVSGEIAVLPNKTHSMEKINPKNKSN